MTMLSLAVSPCNPYLRRDGGAPAAPAPTAPTLTLPADGGTYRAEERISLAATCPDTDITEMRWVLDPGPGETVLGSVAGSFPWDAGTGWTVAGSAGAHTLVARAVRGGATTDSDPIDLTIGGGAVVALTNLRDRCIFGTFAAVDLRPRIICLVFKADQPAAVARILAQNTTAATGTGWRLQLSSFETLQLFFWDAENNQQTKSSAVITCDGRVHVVVCGFDESAAFRMAINRGTISTTTQGAADDGYSAPTGQRLLVGATAAGGSHAQDIGVVGLAINTSAAFPSQAEFEALCDTIKATGRIPSAVGATSWTHRWNLDQLREGLPLGTLADESGSQNLIQLASGSGSRPRVARAPTPTWAF